MSATTAQHALDVLLCSGVCHWRDAIPETLLSECRDAAVKNFGHVAQRLLMMQTLKGGDPKPHGGLADTNSVNPGGFTEIVERDGGRYDMRYQMDKTPFTSPDLIYNPSWFPFVSSVLGDSVCLLYSGVMVAAANPQSEPQKWHGDGGQLYGPLHLPPHCLNVFVPLVDLHESNGPTEFVPGTQIAGKSNRDGKAQFGVNASAGSVVIFDYRVQHRGGANRSADDRLVLYLCYCKPWFRDHVNHRSRVSLFGDGKPIAARILHGTDTEKSQTLPDDSGERWVLFEMDVEIETETGKAAALTVQVCHGDQPREVAAAFCKRHGLGDHVIEPLTQQVEQQMGLTLEASNRTNKRSREE